MSNRARLEYGHVRVYGDRQAGIVAAPAPHGGHGGRGGHRGRGGGHGHGASGLVGLLQAAVTLAAGHGGVPAPSPKPLLKYEGVTTTSASGTTGQVTPNWPATVNAGDLLLLSVNVRASTGATSVGTPAGWTLVRTDIDTGNQFHAYLFSISAAGSVSAPTLVNSGTAGATVTWAVAVIRTSGNGRVDQTAITQSVALSATVSCAVATSQANGLVFGFCYERSTRTMGGGTNNTLIYGGIAGGASFGEVGGCRYSGSLATAGTYTATFTIGGVGSNGGWVVALSVKNA